MTTNSSLKPCAICDTDHWVKVLYHFSDYDVLKCQQCGLVYVNQIFDTKKGTGIPEGYEATYLLAESHFISRFRRNIQAIEYLLPVVPGKLLDIGCGVGYFLQVAQERGWDAIGVDLDRAAVEIAQQRGVRVLWERAEELPFHNDEFDVVTLFNVIEHLPRPQVVLMEIRRVLKSDGLFVLETPTEDFGLGYFLGLLYRLSGGKISHPLRYLYSSYEKGGHVYRFSRKTITMILQKTGFEVQHISPGENPSFRLYLSKRNFQKSQFVKVVNFIIFGLAFSLVNLAGLRSRMVVYARVHKS